MDNEFHYHLTYLLAAHAGFTRHEAYIIAYSSQYVNDNDIRFRISSESGEKYMNEITQFLSVPAHGGRLLQTAIAFHYIPGNPYSLASIRKDHRLHWLAVSAGNETAHTLLREALRSQDPFRIGIAIHAFADTYAHQNFTGAYDAFNAIHEIDNFQIHSQGHADARRLPDRPCALWVDTRLIDEYSRIDNRVRILDAAANIFSLLLQNKFPLISQDSLRESCDTLLIDLTEVLGRRDDANAFRDERIQRYRALSRLLEYGGAEMPDYRDTDWLDRAVTETVFDLRLKVGRLFDYGTSFPYQLTWKSANDFRASNWYKFQEAVKAHRSAALKLIENGTPYLNKSAS